jgi:hypothetical protein
MAAAAISFAAISFAAICFAAVSLAGTEPRVSRATLQAVEGAIDQTFAPRATDPFDVLGQTRGTYLEGYGSLFTVELDLIPAGPLNPFRPTVSKAEIDSTRERKLKNLAALKPLMRTILVNASGTLEGQPSNERVAIETILLYFSWEDSKGLPRRVTMSAEKQKLLEARAAHASQTELAAFISEQEQ